jgi:hypothetical protein
MKQKFWIAADQSCGLVRIVMTGLFTLDDVRAFYEERRRAHEALGLPKNQHLTLNDVRDLKILPQDTLAAFCDMLADPDYHSRRLAFVVGTTLVRAQIMRAIGGRGAVRCFDNPADAERWLIDSDTPAMPRHRAVG